MNIHLPRNPWFWVGMVASALALVVLDRWFPPGAFLVGAVAALGGALAGIIIGDGR